MYTPFARPGSFNARASTSNLSAIWFDSAVERPADDTTALRKGRLRYCEHDVYPRNDERLATLGADKLRTEVMGRHEALISKLIQYCRDEFGLSWNRADAETALNEYLLAAGLLVPDLLATGVGDPLKDAKP